MAAVKFLLASTLLALVLSFATASNKEEQKHDACVKGAQEENRLCQSHCKEMKEELPLQKQCFEDCKFFLRESINDCNKDHLAEA